MDTQLNVEAARYASRDLGSNVYLLRFFASDFVYYNSLIILSKYKEGEINERRQG